MNNAEFSRTYDLRSLPAASPVKLEATPEECAALARRFGIVAIHSLAAEVSLLASGAQVAASGRLRAALVQSCAVSGEDLSVTIDEPLAFRFVPERAIEEEEIELEEEALDEIEYGGSSFDLGEAVAQSLALAANPYLTGPDADRVRSEVGLSDERSSGPFAALAALKKK